MYEFFINNVSLEEVRAFCTVAEQLPTWKHTSVEWRKTASRYSNAVIKIMINQDGYAILFKWLKDRQLKAKITKTKGAVKL